MPEDAGPLAALLAFVRALRAAGLEASSERVHAFVRAVDVLGLGGRTDLYWAGRLTLCGGRDDLERYERVFAVCFGPGEQPPPRPAPPARTNRARLTVQGARTTSRTPAEPDRNT
ncbi:hypothetical protein N4P33_35255, partial [Streptomyces sp. 15-116A]|nr:hypothetical protein [Streptomyces sp. 15-116A]